VYIILKSNGHSCN